MVYCKKLVDDKCEFTGGKCIVKNPKTIEDYKVCPERKLAKDYDEMTQSEKALYNSIRNQKKICEIEDKISGLLKNIGENEEEFDYLYADVVDLRTRVSILENKGLKVKRGIFKRLFSRK